MGGIWGLNPAVSAASGESDGEKTRCWVEEIDGLWGNQAGPSSRLFPQ